MDARDGLESREDAVPGGAVPDEPEATKSDSYVARRKTLKAAVVGGATVGAVWAAPRVEGCLLYTSPSPRDRTRSRMPSSA